MCYGKHHCKAGEEAWECTYCIGTGEDIGDKRKRGENGGGDGEDDEEERDGDGGSGKSRKKKKKTSRSDGRGLKQDDGDGEGHNHSALGGGTAADGGGKQCKIGAVVQTQHRQDGNRDAAESRKEPSTAVKAKPKQKGAEKTVREKDREMSATVMSDNYLLKKDKNVHQHKELKGKARKKIEQENKGEKMDI